METQGVAAVASFGISLENSAHIMTILRDTLYSDKVMAVMREYSANAWDAHRSIGKHDVPIQITMPTIMEPTLSIRDHGPGLSHNDVFHIFTQYGASTKRNDDNTVGMLGIGSKSGFAYADSFTVTSWHDGMKRVYVAVLDATDKGLINLLHEEPCDTQETGILIQLAVKQQDIGEFTRKATQLFRHFNPRPKINLDLPAEHKGLILKHGYIRDAEGWTAVMGCVPYRVNIDQLLDDTTRVLPPYLYQISGVLFFDIGDVQVNASREELKYSASTKKAIREKIDALVDEYVAFVLKEIKSKSKDAWSSRLMARDFKLFMLPVDEADKLIGAQSVDISNTPKSFVFASFKKNKRSDIRTSLHVNEKARIVIRDDNRNMKGYSHSLANEDYVLVKHASFSWASMEENIEEFLEERRLTGIPVVKISSLPWRSTGYNGGSGERVTPPQSIRVFELVNPKAHTDRALSACWKQADCFVASPTDVFVVLDRFETNYSFYNMYIHDAEMFAGFKMTMPKVYGYRSTGKRPVKTEDCMGLEYQAWREKMLPDMATKQAAVLDLWVKSKRFSDLSKDDVALLNSSLGAEHPITTYVSEHVEAQKKVNAFNDKLTHAVQQLSREVKIEVEDDDGNVVVDGDRGTIDLHERYPLLSLYDFSVLWDQERDRHVEWTQYVQLIDAVNQTINQQA